jgi:hypothetical protein
MIDNQAARIQTNCTVSNRMKSIDASRKATNILLHLKGQEMIGILQDLLNKGRIISPRTS